MDAKHEIEYIFLSLFFILVITTILNLVMNFHFVQQKIELSETLYLENQRLANELKLLNYLVDLEDGESPDFSNFYVRSENPLNYNIRIFSPSGLVIAGNRDVGKIVLNDATKEMFNNQTNSLRIDNTFFSYTYMIYDGDVYYILLDQSDQSFKEETRRYYLRVTVNLLIVSSIVMLLGFKIIQKFELDAKLVD